MSWEKHDDNCEGCRPAILDVKTGKKLPETHPLMQASLAVWANTTRLERVAYHRVMCGNSRDLTDILIVKGIMNRIRKAHEKVAQ
jgi:hypothetical protein